MARLETIIRRFQQADRDTRLETLLDYARKLPPLPERLVEARAAGLNRVHECQTPVYLWVDAGEGPEDIVEIHADVPRESPTVRGFLSLLIQGLQGMTRAEVAALPGDLLDQLRLTETIGMNRTQGLSAIVTRIRRAAGG
ncbi:MAG TPA: SufE family protein [Gemmatimonadales bacterium]|nr:SufE family protein [Gemmatimonadales bacterium]